MDPRLQLQLVAGLCLLAGLACGVGYKPAVTADAVAEARRPDKVLVDYLAQTSADAVVCDVRRRDGPSLAVVTPRTVRTLTRALDKGELSPFRWTGCTRLLWEGASPTLRQDLRQELVRHHHLEPVSALLAELDTPDEAGGVPLPEGVVVLSAAWEPGPHDTVLLRVVQDPAHGVVRLLPAAADGTRSPDPSLDLHGSLEIRVQGLDTPVTLCPSQDQEPCYPPERLELVHPVAVLAPTGRVRFAETLALDEVLELGQEGDRLAAQVVVGGAVAELDLPIRWDSVPGATWRIGTYGNHTLEVDAWELSHERLLMEYPRGREQRRQLVPFEDRVFGLRGLAAEPGEDFDILVRLRCTNCEEARGALERMITTERGQVRIREVED